MSDQRLLVLELLSRQAARDLDHLLTHQIEGQRMRVAIHGVAHEREQRWICWWELRGRRSALAAGAARHLLRPRLRLQVADEQPNVGGAMLVEHRQSSDQPNVRNPGATVVTAGYGCEHR